MARKGRAVHHTTDWCHICGLAIPNEIGSSTHPLYGTVDHILPLSRGGGNDLLNRRAAHRICNAQKRDRLLSEFRPTECEELRAVVRQSLNRIGIPCGPEHLRKARNRTGAQATATKSARIKALKRKFFVDGWGVWENEGGRTN